MNQSIEKILAVGFTSPSTVEEGDVVRIADDLTVGALNAEADPAYVGTVIVHNGSDLFCTVATRFRERKNDRVAAAAIDVGPFVWDADMKAVAYTVAGRATVTGTQAETFAVVDPVGATVTGTQAETFEITLDTNDKVQIKVGSGESQVFTLTAGAARTAAQVAADFAAAVGFTASAVDGKIHFAATAGTDDLTIEAVANDAYTALGLTADTYAYTEGANTVSISVAGGESQVFTLTAGAERTAAQVVADFAAASGFAVSAVSGKIKLTASNAGEDLEIEACDNDAYTVLGFEAGTIDVSESSHDPSSVAGLIIKGTQPLVVRCNVVGPFEITNATNDAVKLKVGSGESQTFDLTAGEARTATQIAADLNATGTGFTASASGGKLVLTADSDGDDIEIETVANNAYATLGLTVGVYAAPMTVETLEK